MPITYPLDLSGTASSNLVENELHTVSESHFRDYFFIIPIFTPFYIDNFKATITIGNTTRNLVEDVDYSFVLQDVTGTRTTGKSMYGGISLHNLNLNGIISISYQTIGGENIADRLKVLTTLADKAYNPRTTIFDILDGVPNVFPPVPHYQDYDSFFGQEKLVEALGLIRDAIIQNSSLTQDQLRDFLRQINGTVLGSYLLKTGDTMTGRLLLNGSPVEPLEAATKEYVDKIVSNNSNLASLFSEYHNAVYVDEQLATKVNKTGDTMTGPLLLSRNPLDQMEAANKYYIDMVKTDLENKINGLETAVSNLGIDRVTQQYVDDKINEVMSYFSSISFYKKPF